MIRSIFTTKNEHGFTLVEIIIAITLIGIAVPTIMMPFSGLKDTKHPEYTVQGSFMAQKKMEELAKESKNTIASQISASCSATIEGAYSMTCTSIDVNASDPDSSDGGTSGFAKKVTLTVSRTDGEMSPLVFTSLFAID